MYMGSTITKYWPFETLIKVIYFVPLFSILRVVKLLSFKFIEISFTFSLAIKLNVYYNFKNVFCTSPEEIRSCVEGNQTESRDSGDYHVPTRLASDLQLSFWLGGMSASPLILTLFFYYSESKTRRAYYVFIVFSF